MRSPGPSFCRLSNVSIERMLSFTRRLSCKNTDWLVSAARELQQSPSENAKVARKTLEPVSKFNRVRSCRREEADFVENSKLSVSSPRRLRILKPVLFMFKT